MTRVERLKKRRFGQFVQEIYDTRKIVFERVYREYADEPKIIRKARALAAFLQEKQIILEPDDLLAGYQQWYDFTEPEDLSAEPTGDEKEHDLLSRFATGHRIGLFCG